MKFKRVLPALKNGGKVKKPEWLDSDYIYLGKKGLMDKNGKKYFLSTYEFVLDDWEIVKEPWKPEKGDMYYFVTSIGVIAAYEWKDNSFDKKHLQFGNCFKTEKEAERVAKRFRQLLREIKDD